MTHTYRTRDCPRRTVRPATRASSCRGGTWSPARDRANCTSGTVSFASRSQCRERICSVRYKQVKPTLQYSIKMPI